MDSMDENWNAPQDQKFGQEDPPHLTPNKPQRPDVTLATSL